MDIAFLLIFGLLSIISLIFAIVTVFESYYSIFYRIKCVLPLVICSTIFTFTLINHINPPVYEVKTYEICTVTDSRGIQRQVAGDIAVTKLFGIMFPPNTNLTVTTYGGWHYGIYFSKMYSYAAKNENIITESINVDLRGSLPEK